MKQLTVYVVTYNRCDMLRKAVDSILGQSFSDFDLVILDNCSSDSTADYAAGVADPRVSYIRHEKNLGGTGNINFGLTHSRTKYFAVFHDDDILHDDLLAQEIAYLENNPEVVCVSSQANHIDKNGQLMRQCKVSTQEPGRFSGKQFFTEYLYNQKNFVFPATVYRTDFMHQNSIVLDAEAGPCADVVLYMDIERKGGTVAELPLVLLDYRVYPGQDSSSNLETMLIRLMHYLSTNAYYRELLGEETAGKRRYVRWFTRRLLARVASECITSADALNYLEQMGEELQCAQACVSQRRLLKLQSAFPGAMRFAYRVIKKRK